MLSKVFLTVADLSIISGILILVVIMIRTLFCRSPKWTRYILWGIVAVRLICPFFIRSELSILPRFALADYIEKSDNSNLYEKTNISVVDNDITISGIEEKSFVKRIISYLSIIWLLGIGSMLIIYITECLILRRKTKYAVHKVKMEELIGNQLDTYTETIYFVDHLKSPFTKGLLNPKIYMSSSESVDNIPFIIAHEKVHISRWDPLWEQLGYFVLAAHWFNPLVWIAYFLFVRDVEYACDEKVVLELGESKKEGYIKAMLECIEREHKISLNTVAFGRMPIRRRLKEIMNIKKLSIGATVVAIVAGIGVGVFFATRPAKAEMNAEDEVIESENKNEITSEVEESVTTEPEVTYKLTDEGEIILPKGSEMNPENAILVPKEEWEGLGLLDPSKYEAIPGGMGEIRYVEKWNVETGDGEFKTYFCVHH